MKILVTLATKNRLAGKLFLDRSAQILNGEFLPKALRGHVTFTANVYDPTAEDASLAESLLEKGTEVDAIAVLLDLPLAHNAAQLNSAIFIGQIDFTSYVLNVQNLLSGQAARLLRNFGLLLKDLEDSTFFQAAVLPLRNFSAVELSQLADLCKDDTMNGEFGANASRLIRQLVKRRGPKRRSQYPDKYFIDDIGHHFRYGYEKHSRFDTGGSHTTLCHLNGLFRFGKRLKEEHHFNVTDGVNDDDHITATFKNCHNQIVEIVDRTHVNMFSSDFHK